MKGSTSKLLPKVVAASAVTSVVKYKLAKKVWALECAGWQLRIFFVYLFYLEFIFMQFSI